MMKDIIEKLDNVGKPVVKEAHPNEMAYVLTESGGMVEAGMASAARKHGRRKSGAYTRPGSKKEKRAASKGARQYDDDSATLDSSIMPDGPYEVIFDGDVIGTNLSWEDAVSLNKDKGEYGEIISMYP